MRISDALDRTIHKHLLETNTDTQSKLSYVFFQPFLGVNPARAS